MSEATKDGYTISVAIPIAAKVTTLSKTRVWDFDLNPHLAYEDPDSLTSDSYWGNYDFSEQLASGRTSFHKDHLGSTTVVTDQYGDTLEDFGQPELTQYRPYGQTRHDSVVNTITDYNFTDQELDHSTGLYNYDARLYNPEIAMFITADSLIQNTYDPQFLNRYAYCRNNPIKYIDPSGHAATVDGTEEYRKEVETALQKIDSSVRVNMDTGEVTRDFKTAVKNFFGGKQRKGSRLMRRIVKNDLTVKIEDDTATEYQSDLGRDGEKVGGTITWSNKNTTGGKVPVMENGKRVVKGEMPAHIGLGHEIIHADHGMRGGISANTSDPDNPYAMKSYTDATGKEGIALSEELRTIGVKGFTRRGDTTENDLRAQSSPQLPMRLGVAE